MLRAGHIRRPADRAFAALCPELRANSHQGARYNGSCAALSSQTPLPPQPPPTPCQTTCSAYGKGVEHTTQCRVFCADSLRRQHDVDPGQIALGGGRSAVWHVLITRRRDTRVFLPPSLARVRAKSGCWRLDSAIPGADVRAAAGRCRRSRVEMQRGLGRLAAFNHGIALLAATRPCAPQCSRTTKQLVGLCRLERHLSFGYARSGFLSRRCVMSWMKSQRTPLMCARHHDETLRFPVDTRPLDGPARSQDRRDQRATCQ